MGVIHVVLTVAKKGMQYIVVLLPNSELIKCNNERDADARTEDHGVFRLFKLPITSLFVVKNTKCR